MKCFKMRMNSIRYACRPTRCFLIMVPEDIVSIPSQANSIYITLLPYVMAVDGYLYKH